MLQKVEKGKYAGLRREVVAETKCKPSTFIHSAVSPVVLFALLFTSEIASLLEQWDGRLDLGSKHCNVSTALWPRVTDKPSWF